MGYKSNTCQLLCSLSASLYLSMPLQNFPCEASTKYLSHMQQTHVMVHRELQTYLDSLHGQTL